jgi:hypothetical protein
MKTFELEFSFRDWRKGCELLEKLGHNENGLMTSQFELKLESWELEFLLHELNGLDLEFAIDELS